MIIDDGGHTAGMMNASLAALFPSNSCMTAHSVYVIEDTHTLAMCKPSGSGYCRSAAQISGIVSSVYEGMHRTWQPPHATPLGPAWASRVSAIHLYDSMIFLIRQPPRQRGSKPGMGGSRPALTRVVRGSDFFPNEEGRLNPPGTYGPEGQLAHLLSLWFWLLVLGCALAYARREGYWPVVQHADGRLSWPNWPMNGSRPASSGWRASRVALGPPRQARRSSEGEGEDAARVALAKEGGENKARE